jgi:hypothetical protein
MFTLGDKDLDEIFILWLYERFAGLPIIMLDSWEERILGSI